LLIVVQTVVRSESLGIATALLSFMRTLGGTLGVTLMWIPIRNSLGEINFESALILSEIEQRALTSAIQQSFIVGLISALICIPLYLFLPKLDLEEKDRKRFADI
jgi:ABC-type molybdate transport system permease subunit